MDHFLQTCSQFSHWKKSNYFSPFFAFSVAARKIDLFFAFHRFFPHFNITWFPIFPACFQFFPTVRISRKSNINVYGRKYSPSRSLNHWNRSAILGLQMFRLFLFRIPNRDLWVVRSKSGNAWGAQPQVLCGIMWLNAETENQARIPSPPLRNLEGSGRNSKIEGVGGWYTRQVRGRISKKGVQGRDWLRGYSSSKLGTECIKLTSPLFRRDSKKTLEQKKHCRGWRVFSTQIRHVCYPNFPLKHPQYQALQHYNYN